MTDQIVGGFGVKLKITVSNALTAITHLEEIDYPELSKVLATVKCHDDAGGYPRKIDTGRREASAIKGTLVWVAKATTHAAVTAAFDSTASVAMSIEDPEGTEVITFDGQIAKMGRESKQDGVYRCKVEIEIDGEPTIDSGSV